MIMINEKNNKKDLEIVDKTLLKKKERLLELDALRGIAFLFIVLQHTIGGFSYRDDINFNDFIISKFIYTIAQIGVMLFIFLTAVSLVYTYYDEINIKDFYIKKLKYLVCPFVIWSLIIMINNGDSFNTQSILVIFSGDAQYHLWYMGMILRIYLYFPLLLFILKKVNSKRKYIKGAVFAFCAASYAYILSHYGISDFIINLLFKNPTDVERKIVNISPLFYYFYFVIGAYAMINYKNFKKIVLKYKYAVIMLYMLCLEFYYYLAVCDRIGNPFPFIKSSIIMSIIFRVMSILFFYLVSCYIANKSKYVFKVLNVVSRYSFPAYLLHVLVLNKLTGYISTGPYIMAYIKYFFAATILSVLICIVLNYIPYSEYFIGKRSKFKSLKFKEMIYLKHA